MACINIISSDGSLLVQKNSDCSFDLKIPSASALNLHTVNSNTVLLAGNGSSIPLRADVKLSTAAGNALIQRVDGLFTNYPSYTETLLSVKDTTTVDLTASGQSSHTLKADVKIATDTGNALIVKSTGLFVPASAGGGTYTDAQARLAISANAPLTYSGLSGTVGITKADASHAGYLGASDWSLFNSKEPAILAGGTNSYWRGDKTFQLLNTSAVQEGFNLYFTIARARTSLSAAVPIVYNNVTGVFSVAPAATGADGYLTSADWNTFNNKVVDGTSLASGGAYSVFKDKNASKILELRGIKAGANISLSYVADDIVIDSTPVIPSVNAGPDQSIVLPTSSITTAGGASSASGSIVSTLWTRISGPATYFVTNNGSLSTTITGLVEGTYAFRLSAVNSFGLVSTDSMTVVVSSIPITLDTIYVGTAATGATPNEAAILAGVSSAQNGALDVVADWVTLSAGGPVYCFFAIPSLGAPYAKNKWFVDTLNNGDIGGISDLFGALTTVTVAGNPYLVGITNYATQFVASCQLRKV